VALRSGFKNSAVIFKLLRRLKSRFASTIRGPYIDEATIYKARSWITAAALAA
jgi:hypothetical protein